MSKPTKKDIEQRGIEYRYAFMTGYQKGFADATPMQSFCQMLMDIGDPKVVKKVQAWAEKERQKEVEQKQELTQVRKDLDTAIEIVKDLMAAVDNPALSSVEDACIFLGHPEDPNHKGRCYCGEVKE